MEERSGDFLIYGGLLVEAGQAQSLSAAVDEVRARRGVPRDYRLKFNPGPSHFSHQEFIALKQEILELAAAHNSRLLVYLILHDIAINSDQARRNGINTVCYHFQCVLNRVRGPGLVLIDRFNDAGNQIDAHLRDKFSVGLTGMPFNAELRLSSIVGFHYSAIGQSHFSSIVDIALGSLRFALNAHTQQQTQNEATAREILAILSPLFWRETGRQSISELGIAFSPKVINAPAFRTRYENLKAFLASAGIETDQAITGERTY